MRRQLGAIVLNVANRLSKDTPQLLAPDEAKRRSEELYQKAKTVLEELSNSNVPDADSARKELVRLIDILGDIERSKDGHFFWSSEIGFELLRKESKDFSTAIECLHNVRMRVERNTKPVQSYLRRVGGPLRFVILGLMMSGFLLYIVPITVSQTVLQKFGTGIDSDMLLLLVYFGAIGGYVSILVRIKDFSRRSEDSYLLLFFTGFSKPLIGIVFAVVTVLLIDSKLISIVVEPQDQDAFYLSIAFLAGFSERLSRDALAKSERSVSSGF